MVTNVKLLVIEYVEGCGYNVQNSFNSNGENFSFWASKTPFNRSLMQQYINRKIAEFPNLELVQEMIYSKPFQDVRYTEYDD